MTVIYIITKQNWPLYTALIIGSVGAFSKYLADKINCPVYATSFPKLLIENRLKEFGKLDSIDLNELDTHEAEKSFDIVVLLGKDVCVFRIKLLLKAFDSIDV